MKLHRSLLAFLAAAMAAPGLAQELASPPAERISPDSCLPRAAVYAAGSIRVWVTRIGTMLEDNPLRPLSRERLLVLQVVVNGRSATAYGPNFDQMRQGGSPARLEEASGSRIDWKAGARELPASFRVVAEDGRPLLGPLAFQSCGDAPAVAAEKPAQARRRPSEEGRRAPDGSGGGNRPGLPQGAIPSGGGGGGLSLPPP